MSEFSDKPLVSIVIPHGVKGVKIDTWRIERISIMRRSDKSKKTQTHEQE